MGRFDDNIEPEKVHREFAHDAVRALLGWQAAGSERNAGDRLRHRIWQTAISAGREWRRMTACGVRVSVRAKIATVAAAIVTASILGCSHADGPAPAAGGVSSANMPPTTTEPLPAARKEDKAVALTTAANVHLQPVTADDYKRIIADQKGKVVLVDFWATWCGPCREKFPHTLALAKKYGPEGLTVVSVCMDSPDPKDQEKALHFLQSQNAEITNLSNRNRRSGRGVRRLRDRRRGIAAFQDL